MGGATRFKMLFATPFPSPLLLHHRPSSLLFLCRPSTSTTATYFRHLSLCPPIKSFQLLNLHTQPLNSHTPNQLSQSHPWAEWSQFISVLTSSPGQQSLSLPDHELRAEDALVVYEEKELTDEFLRLAAASLAFARARPDLLGLLSRRDIEVMVTNGTPFLFKSALDTARRMRAYLAADGGNVLESANPSTVDIMKYILSYASKPVGSSVSNSLFSRELVESSIRNLLRQIRQVSFGELEQDMPASEHHPFPGCDKTYRPLGQHVRMKRGDWICPKCSFMNFARNMKCLECEEPRAKRQLTGMEWECPQCNFFNFGKKMVCLRCDCKRPCEVSQLGDTGYNLNKTMDGKLGENGNRCFSEDHQLNNASKLDHLGIAVERSAQINPSASFLSSSTSEYQRSSTSNTRHVPFVPLPADMFAKQNQDLKPELPATSSSDFWKSGADDPFSGNPEVQSGNERNAEVQDEKAERLFQRAEELHDVKDTPTAISDDDFPEIMPMRKGENRFVVSKKKDRSLTSPAYKRQVAMEQGRNPDFVPFVPFPPGYFAKKDQEAPDNIDSSTKPSGETCSGSTIGESIPETTADLMPRLPKYDSVKETVKQGRSSGDQSPRLSGVHMSPPNGNLGQNTSTSPSPKHDIYTNRFPTENDKLQSMDAPRGSAQFPDNQITRSVGTGKSLEGSAVKETDPLDMSEEAKAERWFRRVAQIKDISELSQIPDEDFPSIMPMRKGVNRFVVSKRKTPLERRLTSPQYRRNLPSMVSDPVKTDNDSS